MNVVVFIEFKCVLKGARCLVVVIVAQKAPRTARPTDPATRALLSRTPLMYNNFWNKKMLCDLPKA